MPNFFREWLNCSGLAQAQQAGASQQQAIAEQQALQITLTQTEQYVIESQRRMQQAVANITRCNEETFGYQLNAQQMRSSGPQQSPPPNTSQSRNIADFIMRLAHDGMTENIGVLSITIDCESYSRLSLLLGPLGPERQGMNVLRIATAAGYVNILPEGTQALPTFDFDKYMETVNE